MSEKDKLFVWQVRWNGKLFLYLGDTWEAGGPIATRQQYVNGEISQAHLSPDGTIFRYGKQVGVRADLKRVRRVRKPKPNIEAGVMLGINMLDFFCDGPPKD